MELTWKERLKVQPELMSFESWPYIETNLIPTPKQKQFLRNKRITSKVLTGSSLKIVADEFGVSSSFVSQMLTRCLAGDELTSPSLTKALIPGTRINQGARKVPLSDISKPRGSRGALTHILETVPNLKEQLDAIIIAGVKRERNGQNLTAKFFHKEFLRLLIDANWPKTSYPFDQQCLGYESCRLYLNKRIADIKMPKPRKMREVLTKKTVRKPYQEIQIDAQIQDINTHINLEFNGHNIPLRISRVTLFLATDVATGCRLAYHLCLTKDPTQMDLLSLLEKIHSPWEPLNLKTPSLEYEPEACLPSALGELNQNVSVGMIRLDNALCHMSHLVKDYVCNVMGATLNFGLPAQPKGRNYVEYAFNLLNQHTHRFASTTGSSSHDKLKETEKNLKKPPVISLDAFNEILSVLITHHNVIPQELFGGLRPLDIMKIGMEQFFVPLSFAQINNRANPFVKQKKVNVKWLEHENRMPHISFEGLRYTGNGLNNANVIRREIIIEYDIRDIRYLKAYSSQGDELGLLYASKSWQSFPHSIFTRKRVRKETRRHRILNVDPLAGYFSFLMDNKELPKYATEILRVYKEYTGTSYELNVSHAPMEPLQDFNRNSRTKGLPSKRIPSWSAMLTGEELRDD